MNMWLSTWKADQPDRLERLADPQSQVFMADGPAGHCSTVPANAPYSPVARHNKNLNVCFLDGHVAAYSGDYIGCNVGDPQRPDVRWIVPKERVGRATLNVFVEGKMRFILAICVLVLVMTGAVILYRRFYTTRES